jgi:hypothetical protein
MKRHVLALFLALSTGLAWADNELACQAAQGAYLTGTVVRGPVFAHGQYRRGVELSHTHLKLRADQDGQTYDVAVDNVFANGYDGRHGGVPSPINTINVNDRLELCGALYSKGVGIHFVHANCSAPSANHPNGWIRKLDSGGNPGPNLESNTSFCDLFVGRQYRRR